MFEKNIFFISSILHFYLFLFLFPIRQGAKQAALAEHELKEYTREEVSRHASRNDLWVIIDRRVYDLTTYVDPHPGGDGILNNAGGDATKGFLENPSHPAHVFETVKNYQIGRYVPNIILKYMFTSFNINSLSTSFFLFL